MAFHVTEPEASVTDSLIFSVCPRLYLRARGLDATIFGAVLSALATGGTGRTGVDGGVTTEPGPVADPGSPPGRRRSRCR